jgi:hypothetical protein
LWLQAPKSLDITVFLIGAIHSKALCIPSIRYAGVSGNNSGQEGGGSVLSEFKKIKIFLEIDHFLWNR